MAYGLNQTETSGTKKTNDKLYFSSTYGYGMTKSLYLSALLNFNTQFAKGYDYKTEPRTYISRFMSPGYLTTGLGLTWNPKNWITATFSAISWRGTFVSSKILSDEGSFGAEPWTENMRRDIETKLGIKAYDIYGLSEIAGPGVGYECECQNGTHLNEDHYFPEIVDPKTLEPVAPGETGELVFTHLTKEGMPLLRYRTKDLTALHYDKCSCGRTLVRMDRILGRSDDMLIIRGVNVFPTQIESVILEMPEFEPHYLLLVDRKNNTDTMELQVEVRPEYYSDEINKMLALKKKLTARLQSVLGLGVDVRLVEPRSIERSVGKAKRVIDNRKL